MAFAAKKDIKKKKRDSRGSPLSEDSFPSPRGLRTTQWSNRSLTLPSSNTTRFVTQRSVSAAIRGPGEQVLESLSKHRLTWGQASRQRSPTSGQGETSPKRSLYASSMLGKGKPEQAVVDLNKSPTVLRRPRNVTEPAHKAFQQQVPAKPTKGDGMFPKPLTNLGLTDLQSLDESSVGEVWFGLVWGHFSQTAN
jgi:hypothetical protein